MSILASIMKNPTEEQKVMLSAVTALLSDLEKAAKEAENSEEVKKAREEFAEIAAVAMIAQALPDLFKEGDMANVKGLFGELSGVVSDIVGKYEASLDPYYNKVKDDISDNITLLQLQDIISKDITKDKLAKLPHGEIDRILGKIKRLKDKNFTEECILKNEVKYRAEYVEPQKKLMEENIKQTIGDFSKKIQSILSTAAIK
jgi:hypothetical protein